MANETKMSAAVETTDALQAGFQDAMTRIAEVGSHVRTLVDAISNDVWKSWDASDELALVADKDGPNVYDDDVEDVLAA